MTIIIKLLGYFMCYIFAVVIVSFFYALVSATISFWKENGKDNNDSGTEDNPDIPVSAGHTNTKKPAEQNMPGRLDISESFHAADEQYRKDIIRRIKELAETHSEDIPVQHGDGASSDKRMISLTELDMILSTVLDSERLASKKEQEA